MNCVALITQHTERGMKQHTERVDEATSGTGGWRIDGEMTKGKTGAEKAGKRQFFESCVGTQK